MSEKMTDDLKEYVRFAVKFYKAMRDGKPDELGGCWQLMRAIGSEESFFSSFKKNSNLVINSIYAGLNQINHFEFPSFFTKPEFFVFQAILKLQNERPQYEDEKIECEETIFYEECLNNLQKRESLRQCEVESRCGVKYQFCEYSNVSHIWVKQNITGLFEKIYNFQMINDLEYFVCRFKNSTRDFRLKKPDALKLQKWILGRRRI